MTTILPAEAADLPHILALQKLCYHESAVRYNDFTIQPLQQTLSQLEDEYRTVRILKAVCDTTIIGSIRGYETEGVCHIGKVIVHPEWQNRGIGTLLMKNIEQLFAHAGRYDLFTGYRDEKNLYFYRKLGYTPYGEKAVNAQVRLVFLEKRPMRDAVNQHR